MPQYAARQAFPKYSYVPGKFPHPTRNPAGHSHGHELSESPPPTPEQWRDCQSYLWGIDLFNHGYYWEAHEAWEAAWIGAGRRGSVADLLKALIKVAAAGVKAREGREVGVRRHALRCVQLVDGIQAADRTCFLGLNLDDLKTAASAIAENARSVTQRASADFTDHSLPVQINLRLV